MPDFVVGLIRSVQLAASVLANTALTVTPMSVEVTFDALPDQIFTGNVTHVAPVSSTDKGSTNYTIHVTVDDLDPELRWGMTAFVNIAAPR